MSTLLSADQDIYDAINPQGIPASAKTVAAYVDGNLGLWITDPKWFPSATHVTISAIGAKIAMVGDREAGDMSAAGLVTYIQRCRAAGVNTIGYCNYSSWQEAQDAFNNAHV